MKKTNKDKNALSLRGVVEGFFGPPWSHAARIKMIDFMGDAGYNCYIYAPKDDPFHRDRWREDYPKADAKKIAALADFEDSPLFTPAERAAIRLGFKAGRQPNEAGPADFDALKAHYDDGQIVEIVAAIALFGYLNRWNDTMATTLEPHALEVARRTIGPTGWVAGKHG